MKILFIYPMSAKSTGPKSVILALCRCLLNNNNEIGIYTASKYSNEVEDMLKHVGAKYYYVKNNLGIPQIERDVIDYSSYDIIHLHSIFSCKIWLVAKSIIKIQKPYVVSIHGNLMEAALKRSSLKKRIALRLIVKKILRNSTIIHALALKEKQDIEKIVNHCKIQVVPNGIDGLQEVHETDRCCSQKTILFLGRIDIYHKGIDLLLNAITKRLDELMSHKVKIIFAGYFNKPVDRKIVNEILNKNEKLSSIIELVGEVNGVAKHQLFQSCDIFVHTSRLEGMPMAVLEALSYGKPCLVTPETNMRDIIIDSGSGLVVDLDENAIANGILQLVRKDKVELKKLGDRGLKWCEKNLLWTILVNDYISLYKEALSKGDF